MSNSLAAQVRDALRCVIDPELGENIVDLGFIYDIVDDNGRIRITMTATTPGCPATGMLQDGARAAAFTVPGVLSVDVTMVFEPAWTLDLIAPPIRSAMGLT
jgi:metal-sulfur cluster biosynthetic enzyme